MMISGNQLFSGHTLTLDPGRHPGPIALSDLAGTQEQPLVLRGPKATVGPGTPFSEYKREANRLAAMHEDGGSFPGLYFMADNAALTVRNCRWIVIEDLTFDGCWPTAIYLDNCQHVTIRRVSIRGGTVAIGAHGGNTRHLLIEKCDWLQDFTAQGERDLELIRDHGHADPKPDLSDSLLYKATNWLQIHDWVKDTERRVDVETDARAFDGDFFRAWTIAGYVTIRENIVIDAFNGVHFFNQASRSIVGKYSRNVLIEDNWFVRLRDNAVEAEQFAWHWTVRRNRFVDVYAPFSLQMDRSGYFYIYANLGWSYHRPGPDDTDTMKNDRRNGRLFKLPTLHTADGPHYVMHNSWLIRSSVMKKKRLANLVHRNNAIDYYDKGEEFDLAAASPFGEGWTSAYDPNADWAAIKKAEKERFTKAWEELGISFDGDVINHPDFPRMLRVAGYPIGAQANGEIPRFKDRRLGRPEDLRTRKKLPAVDIEVTFPSQEKTKLKGKELQAGAWQGNKPFTLPGPSFWENWPGPSRKAEV